ncbi:WD40-repeat-containing domain protein [Mrakia frigida]|uniref:WD40 repeat domain-containing protein n=1 Tax=Mrakia frigida TaxID=29902 RepID=UPI003FCC053B
MSLSFNNLSRLPPSSSAIGRTKRNALRSAIDGEGFQYSTQLKEHTGCVNAIALSNGEGRWLATGGDDLEVLLWDLHSDLSPPSPAEAAPSGRYVGHQANIFGLAFNSTDSHLFSSGLDGLVHRFDISRLGSSTAPGTPEGPERTVHINDSAVRGISAHPEDPNLLLVAREDNRVYLHDFRLPSTVVHKLASADSWSGVSWSPAGGHLFAGCDEGGALRLFDVRKSFEGTSSAQYTRISAQAFRNALVDYLTPKNIFSDLAGVSFSPNGNLLATNVLGYYPLVYSVGETKPLAVLTTPPKQYRNRVTVKHGGFGPIGNNGETTYVTGSDDYYGYGWTIPTPEVLSERLSTFEGPKLAEELDHKKIWATQNVPENFQPTDLHQPSIRVGGELLNVSLFPTLRSR